MKIRCGSHQQNRSIVRPGLSLMATKVALTAEEFRENSQRSIDLFNTEKLSTDSTHVLKSAYCILCISAVAICTERVEAKRRRNGKCCASGGCNLHGACGGKVCKIAEKTAFRPLQSARSVWRQSSLYNLATRPITVAICTERVEAKCQMLLMLLVVWQLQSARSVWRQSSMRCSKISTMSCCNLHGACGGKEMYLPEDQSSFCCNLHGACGGKACWSKHSTSSAELQSARSVWRQRRIANGERNVTPVAICTERVEAKSNAVSWSRL